ncbi:helix-turn-helix domain-containing protein [Treponema zioleckii]|uniref:helix-turn-helix domain-containing protein n=1 Tax=Treponema zioleckii TaxID=331680 RepID=UPI00168BEF62|nr:helix-turn-helix transcriptional regulator [Treponema zioleckii]
MQENTEIPGTENTEKSTEPISKLFGGNVKKYRKMAGLTQEQLSEKLGISQKHLSIIETGTQFASATLIGKISKTLRVAPGDLFGGSSDELKKEITKTREILMSMFVNELTRKNAILSSELSEIREILKEKL